MPLKLVTGPANAAKAGEVLGGLRARLDDEPILVVPTVGDVEHAQRELAERGAVFGARVLRFDWLFGEIAARAGLRRAGGLRLPARADRGGGGAARRTSTCSRSPPPSRASCAPPRASWPSSGRARRGPAARFTRALRDWAGDGPRRAYADEVAAVYRGYRDGLEAAGLVDEELFAWRGARRAAAEERRRRWGGTPVFVYGFDDFDGLQLDALETSPRAATPT